MTQPTIGKVLLAVIFVAFIIGFVADAVAVTA